MNDDIYAYLKQQGIRIKLGRIHKDDLVKAANIIVAMAWSRENWIDRTQRLLEGALGEYAKYRCAKIRNDKDYWSDEIKKLMENVSVMVSKKTKTKGFGKEKALDEAKRRVSTAQHQIVSGVGEYMRMMRDEEKCGTDDIKAFREKIKKADFRADRLLNEMLSDFPIEID